MTQTRSVRSDLRSVMRAFRMGATWQLAQRTKDPERRMARIYSTIPSDYLFADHTTYLNYGYWDPDCTNLDDASEALANADATLGKIEGMLARNREQSRSRCAKGPRKPGCRDPRPSSLCAAAVGAI